MKPVYRTMWMLPRNIRKIEPWKLVQIANIICACDAQISDQRVQNTLYSQLCELGIKVDTNPNGVVNPGGFRTYLAQLACLGFFFKDPSDNSFKLTYAGEKLISGDHPLQVLRCQLMRMQCPSVYGLGQNVRFSPTMKVKPFVFLVKLLQDPLLDFKLNDKEIGLAVIYGRTFNTFKEKKSVLKELDNLFVFPDFSRYAKNISFSDISKYYVNTVSKLIKYTKYKAVIALPLRLAMSTESALIDFRKNLILSGHLACLQGLPLNYFYLNNIEYVLVMIDKTKKYSKTYVTSNYADNIDLSSNNPFYKLDPDFLLNPRNSNVKSKMLDDVCTIYKALTCKQITYEEYLNLDTKKDAEYSAYKELSLKDVPDTGIILNADKNIYIKKDLKQLQRNLLKKGDLVLSVKGSVGKVGYFNSSRTDVSAGQIFVIIRPKEYSVLSSEALFYILKSKIVQDYIKSVTLKSAPKVLQLTDLKALPLKNSLFADAKSLKLKGQDLIKQLTYAQNELNKLSVAINELNDGVII